VTTSSSPSLKYEDISSTMRAFLGAFEGFRKMGFRADDIYCEVAWSMRFDVLSCFCKLITQGKTFAFEVGEVEDADVFAKEYTRVTTSMREIPQADLDRIWVESEAYRERVHFAAALLAKGFDLPKFDLPKRLS
jgi:hypothetical protein